MNSRVVPMEDLRVRVVLNDTDIVGLRRGQPSLFLDPARTLFEEPTLFLHRHYVQSGRRSSPETWASAAYALQSWFEFLWATRMADWRDADREKLIEYRDAYLSAISPKTGTTYASGTVGNRMAVVLAFYKDAGERRAYDGDLLSSFDDERATGRVLADCDAMAHTHRGLKPVRMVSGLIPKRRISRAAVRPYSTAELRALLTALGPRATDRSSGDRRPARSRLMTDLGWAVGLRLDEVRRLTKLQFLSKHPDPDAPAAEQLVQITGKGHVTRTVVIPNWLVLDVLAYIGDERRQALKAGGITGRQEQSALFLCGINSSQPGTPMSERRMQQEVENGCIRGGLVDLVERIDPETGEKRREKKARHCFHDLRHTYAVITYFAEVRSGNPEPWKKIQAQLGHKNLSTTTNTYLGFVSILGTDGTPVNIRQVLAI